MTTPARREPLQPVKFYQTQTFTVGNRLVDGYSRAVQTNMRRTNSGTLRSSRYTGTTMEISTSAAIDGVMPSGSVP